MLPSDEGTLIEVGDVVATNLCGVLLQQHPADVGIEESFRGTVRVFGGVSVSVVGTMVTRPPADASLHGAGTKQAQHQADWECSIICTVSPQAMVTWTEKGVWN